MNKQQGKALLLSWMVAAAVGVAGLAYAESDDQPAGLPDNKAAAGQDQNKEVVIRGVQRLRVKTEKPEPEVNFDVDEIAVPYVKTEDDVLNVSPTSMALQVASVPDALASEHTASPYVQIFQRPPILNLNPQYKSNIGIANWRLRITDGYGNVFKDFSGKNSLPKQIIWDGHGNQGNMVDVGTSYSYIFSVVDVASNPTSSMGKPIILESLLSEEGGVTVAKVLASAFFEKQGRKTGISDKGKLYLREVTDLLLARQNFPLVMEVYAKDVDDASYKGEMIQEYLTELLSLPKDRFKIVPQKSNLEKIIFKIR